jgi:type VI secretion system protein ImpF
VADAFSRDRLQPALLDRLIDDDRSNTSEAVETRAVGKQRLRQCVLRDLNWLFNANAGLHDLAGDAQNEHSMRSTLNFGIHSLSGMLASKVELVELERELKQAIINFEPRILPDTLVVRGIAPADPLGHHNVLQFEIKGRLWAQPYPLELLLKTDLDLETGLISLHDGSQTIRDRID